MTERSRLNRPRSSILGPSAVGIATGAALALFLEVVPVLGTPLLALVAVAALAIVARRRGDPKSVALFAGMFVGAGLVFAYGLVSTVTACAGTPNFCGETPLLPIVVLAVVSFALGAVCATIGFRSSNRTSSTRVG